MRKQTLQQPLRMILRVATVAGVLLSAWMIVYVIHRAATYFMMDVQVFQDAGWAFRRGQDLYSDQFPTRSGFRFIYPPFAALLFYPLTWAGQTTMQVIWSVTTLASVAAMLWMVSKRLGIPKPEWCAAALLGLVMLMDPLVANIDFGQINVFLAVMIVADVLGFVPKKLRGLGIGVAAGVKITPAAYALIFLVRKDWWGVARSFGWFLVTVAIGYVCRARESTYFWTKEFFAGNRGGEPTYEANQALSGMLARAGVGGRTLDIAILVAFVLGAVLAGCAAYHFEKAGHNVLSLFVVSLAVSWVGPYAVSHHWSITMMFMPIVVAAILAIAGRLSARTKVAASGAVTAVGAIAADDSATSGSAAVGAVSRAVDPNSDDAPPAWPTAGFVALLVGLVAFFVAHYLAPYEVFTHEPGNLATSVGEWLWGNLQSWVSGVVFLGMSVCGVLSRVSNQRPQ